MGRAQHTHRIMILNSKHTKLLLKQQLYLNIKYLVASATLLDFVLFHIYWYKYEHIIFTLRMFDWGLDYGVNFKWWILVIFTPQSPMGRKKRLKILSVGLDNTGAILLAKTVIC
jgi:hypothetical protein